MSCFTDYANSPETYSEFLQRDEQFARWEERRYQATRELYWDEETHVRDAADYDPGNFIAVPVIVTAAGVDLVEVNPFDEPTRKPVKIERMQMELFPEVA